VRMSEPIEQMIKHLVNIHYLFSGNHIKNHIRQSEPLKNHLLWFKPDK